MKNRPQKTSRVVVPTPVQQRKRNSKVAKSSENRVFYRGNRQINPPFKTTFGVSCGKGS